jgi:hypothetical protein
MLCKVMISKVLIVPLWSCAGSITSHVEVQLARPFWEAAAGPRRRAKSAHELTTLSIHFRIAKVRFVPPFEAPG